MIKQLFAVAAVAATTLPAQALTAGDLAFTSFNADEDGFAMVALADVAAACEPPTTKCSGAVTATAPVAVAVANASRDASAAAVAARSP